MFLRKFIQVLLTSLVLVYPLQAQMKTVDFTPYKGADKNLGIKILDVKEVTFEPLEGIEFTEVSALAYDEKRGLFALSDRGYLYTLELKLEAKKIKELKLLNAKRLLSKNAKPLEGKKRDSEGMDILEEGLLISFERLPKVSLFDFNGLRIKNYELPAPLDNIKNYQSKNKALEAVLYHDEFGFITVAEAPLKHHDKNLHTLYSHSQRWQLSVSENVTAIELLNDGNILVLERGFSLTRGHHILLKKVFIKQCEKRVCKSEILASFKSEDGWNLDNFEGLTHIKDNLYLMVSDDNANFFQKCLFVLFEVL